MVAKVAIVTHRYFPNIGGVEKHVQEIAERLVCSFSVEVFTFENNQKEPAIEESINGVLVRRFGSRKIANGIEIPPREFGMSIRKAKPSIVHLHSLHTLIPRYTYNAIKGTQAKFIITPHYHGTGHSIFRNLLFKAYRLSLRKAVESADKVICVSKFEKELIQRDFKVSNEKFTVIPNGMNFNDNAGQPISQRINGKLLFVGRLEKYKNTDKIVAALSLLPKHSNYRLTIVGDGPEMKRLSRLAKKLRLDDRVVIKNELSLEELVSEYQSSELFVMPSYREAYSIVVGEALAHGMRAIVSNTSALSEFVTEGYATGIGIPITPERIADAIQLDSKAKRMKPYLPLSWDYVSNEVKKVYSSSLDSK